MTASSSPATRSATAWSRRDLPLASALLPESGATPRLPRTPTGRGRAESSGWRARRRRDQTRGDRAGELYELLEPFSSQLAVAGAAVWGSIAWALGILANTLEHYEQAESHFAAAAEIEQRVGAPLFLARTHANWARTLIVRGRPEDLERAQQMLHQAEETAERLGGGLVTREVAECRAVLAAISG